MVQAHLYPILYILNLEKHMTATQIVQALYPDDPFKTAYGRVIKQLQRLRTLGLLTSRNFARLEVNVKAIETVWTLTGDEVIRDYGFKPAKAFPKITKYEHERTCADVFTKFCQIEIHGWEQHKKIPDSTIIPDRTVWLSEDLPLYIEVELQTRDRVSEKLTAYQRYFRETRNQFEVLFIVKQLREWQSSRHYKFVQLDDFLSKPLSKSLSTQE